MRGSSTWPRAAIALLLFLLLAAVRVAAQPADGGDATLDALRGRLAAVKQRVHASGPPDALAAARLEATALRRQCGELALALAPRLANVNARLAGLGTAPAGRESPGLAAEREALAEQGARIDAQLRLARLLSIESDQVIEQIDDERRARFNARLFERGPSLLDARYWAELARPWPDTRERLAALWRDMSASAWAAGAGRWLLAAVIAALASIALLALLRALPAVVVRHVPATRLRRSIVTLVHAAAPPCVAFVAGAWVADLLQGPDPPAAVQGVWRSGVAALTFGVFAGAVGRSLLAPARPSWRLLPFPDAVADRLRRDPVVFGSFVAVSVFLDRAVVLIHADVAAQIVGSGVVSLLLGLLLVWSLRRGEQARRAALDSPHATRSALRSLWLLAIEGASWIALVGSLGCLLLGYVALGTVVVKQVAWLIVVASSAYVLIAFLEDAASTWLGGRGAADDGASEPVVASRARAAVVVSALGRIGVVLAAAVAMVGPLGQSPAEWVERLGDLQEGVSFGDVRVLPASIAQAVLVVGLGTWAVVVTRRWLLTTFFPTTQVDDGMRHSFATLVGWVGYVAIWALALSTLGVGLERVTWIASALSVGIGFGLRVFVQNFLAGLMLLSERPMRVGDVVVIEGIEGEIRRINLRTTEIELSDHSVSLVPNFMFATRIARNLTHDRRRGSVRVAWPMPLHVPVDVVLAEMATALDNHVEVLAEPAPTVLVESVDAGAFLFSATGTIDTARRAAVVKSELIRDIASRLASRGLDLKEISAFMAAREPADAAGQARDAASSAAASTLPHHQAGPASNLVSR